MERRELETKLHQMMRRQNERYVVNCSRSPTQFCTCQLIIGHYGHNRHNSCNGIKCDTSGLPDVTDAFTTESLLLLLSLWDFSSVSSFVTFLFVDCPGTRRKWGASRTDTRTFSRRRNGVWHETTNYCKRWRISITAHQPLPQKLKDSSCSKLVLLEYNTNDSLPPLDSHHQTES